MAHFLWYNLRLSVVGWLVGWLVIVGVRYMHVKYHNSEMLKLEVKTYLCAVEATYYNCG